jgi:hypothetical protein
MKRHEVLTRDGFMVAVPHRIWRTWRRDDRRVIAVNPVEWWTRRRTDATYDADAMLEQLSGDGCVCGEINIRHCPVHGQDE